MIREINSQTALEPEPVISPEVTLTTVSKILVSNRSFIKTGITVVPGQRVFSQEHRYLGRCLLSVKILVVGDLSLVS